MRSIRAIIVPALVLAFALVPAAGADPPVPESLDLVLERLDRVAQLYRDSALEFTCDESVTYFARFQRRTDRFRYLYSFHEGVGLTDRRLPRRGKQARGESDMQEPVAHWGLERAYSWAFVFQASLRERYAYELVGARKVHGIPALGVQFEPRPPFERGINDLRGKFFTNCLQPVIPEELDTWINQAITTMCP